MNARSEGDRTSWGARRHRRSGSPRASDPMRKMGDSGQALPPDRARGADWVAAYAMGLASARRRVETCLRELVAAADGEPGRLREACDRLRALENFDADLRTRAERLLTASLDQVDEPARVDAGIMDDRVPDHLDPLEEMPDEGEASA